MINARLYAGFLKRGLSDVANSRVAIPLASGDT